MACMPCQKAREAALATARAIAGGRFSDAAVEVRKATDALSEKSEALRIRRIIQRR